MILVADSGSTKCDWLAIDEKSNQFTTSTMGFNPFFHSTELIEQKLAENELLSELKSEIKEVYFYGAGCSSAPRNEIVAKGLRSFFSSATDVKVDHDLTGAALATSQGEKGISCILGTGSNSCYFDGEKVHEEVPALGYILGDEGSGSYFGKIMLSEWLYKRMPQELASDFGQEYNLTKEGIFEAVHKKENPNVYLAAFMPFIGKHKNHPYFKRMVYEGLVKFVNIHVWCYENFRDVPVNFVGSVAYYFKDVLAEIAENHNFTLGKVERRPIEPLALYHTTETKQIS